MLQEEAWGTYEMFSLSRWIMRHRFLLSFPSVRASSWV